MVIDSRQRLGKAVMVPVWSSGFIVGTLAVRHATGLSILFWRMSIASLVMGGICLAMRVQWPRDRRTVLQMVLVGLLLQAAQFVGIFLALEHGVSAGLTALLAGSSPLIVAALATVLLDEHLKPIQWVGSVIGVVGVVFAVIESLNGGGSAIGFGFAVLGLAGLVGGTLVQRVGGADVDPRAGHTIQLVGGDRGDRSADGADGELRRGYQGAWPRWSGSSSGSRSAR